MQLACSAAVYEPSHQSAPYGGVGGPVPGGVPYLGQQLLTDPVASMAMQYGQTLAGQGTEIIHKNVCAMHFLAYLTCIC